MYDLIDLTASKIDCVVKQQRSISLSNLEYTIDASYNMIFLAVERLVARGKLRIKKSEGDYIISLSNIEEAMSISSDKQ